MSRASAMAISAVLPTFVQRCFPNGSRVITV
jgi:hypothetical protein